MKYAVKTDIGQKRIRNEDSYSIIFDMPGVPDTFVIADGMGGHNSGEIASKLAVDFVSKYIISNPDEFSTDTDLLQKISDLVKKANSFVIENALKNIENSGMGTTLIIALVSDGILYIGHVGDSRVYKIDENKIIQITRDHSYIEELIKSGSITKEEALNHPQRNILTRAVGSTEEIEVDCCTVELKNNEQILICTDGLTNMLSDELIKEIMNNSKNSEDACEKLIDASIENGGEDNITAIILES